MTDDHNSEDTRYDLEGDPAQLHSLGPGQVDSALRRCCAYRRPAIISSVETPAAFPGYFSDLDGDRLILTLALPGFEAFFKPASKCLVTFLHRSRSCVFVTSVRSLTKDSGTGDLVVDTPAMISKVEMRRFFRVPVSRDTDLKLRIVTEDGGVWDARCIDVSMAGMLVAFPEDQYPALAVGDALQLKVDYRGEPTTIHAEVRRRHGRRVGVFFPAIYHEGHLQPPDELSTVVKFVEREWRAKRADFGYSD